MPDVVDNSGYQDLWGWFGLSRASWLTLPRVLMHEMPDEWQGKMAALLREYNDTFTNWPQLGTRVHTTDFGRRLVKTPKWLINYRYPDYDAIALLRPQPAEESEHGQEAEGEGEGREEALARVQDSGGSGSVGGQHAGAGEGRQSP